MDDFAKLSVDDLLDQVAARTPTPGGGGVTALAGALACALARMVAAYSVTKKTEPPARAWVEAMATHLHRADQLLRALVTRDAQAYAAMTEAAAARKAQATPTPAAEQAYCEAVLEAAAVPLEIAAVASNALATMNEGKSVTSRYILSDLAIAAILADATARASSYTVRINAREVTDPKAKARLHAEIDEITGHCTRHRESIEAFVRDRIQ
jgi:formiminotetrahydrofolate cyclodeaminase